jgi:DNA-binding NarL/FixJ family response regulator
MDMTAKGAASFDVSDPSGPAETYLGLPPGLRLLCVGEVEPTWVTLALELDALGCHEPNFNWVSNASDAFVRLREESYDCLLIRPSPSHQESPDDPLALARALRAGGCLDPLVIVAASADDAAWREALELDVEFLVSSRGWDSKTLVLMIERAIQRTCMRHELGRLSAADRRRLTRERDEADYLLNQQRDILTTLGRLASAGEFPPAPATADLHQKDRPAAQTDCRSPELPETCDRMAGGHSRQEKAASRSNCPQKLGITIKSWCART